MRAVLLGSVWILTISNGSWASGSSFPDEFYFKRTGLPIMRETEYRVMADGIITKVVQKPTRTGIERSINRRRIGQEAWARFQARLLALRLSEWKSEYADPHYDDGYFWEMRFVVKGRRVVSKGRNAGPDPLDPNRRLALLDSRRSGDVLLVEALDRLLTASKPVP